MPVYLLNTHTTPFIDDASFHAKVNYLEGLWRRTPIGTTNSPLIAIGEVNPVVFIPILEHLEFVYARQPRTLSQTRRFILYRRPW